MALDRLIVELVLIVCTITLGLLTVNSLMYITNTLSTHNLVTLNVHIQSAIIVNQVNTSKLVFVVVNNHNKPIKIKFVQVLDNKFNVVLQMVLDRVLKERSYELIDINLKHNYEPRYLVVLVCDSEEKVCEVIKTRLLKFNLSIT